MEPSADSETQSVNPSASPFVPYAADRPILTEAEDRFGRAPFARRTAETVSHLDDPSSIVVGIYGAWGEGKTSVLNLMAEYLKTKPEVILFRFNPWLFDSSDLLLAGFFKDLADALGRSLPMFCVAASVSLHIQPRATGDGP